MPQRAPSPTPSQAVPPAPLALERMPQRLTPAQVAQILTVSVDQVLNYRDAGDLVFINVASPRAARPAWRITRASLQTFMRRRQTTP